MGALLIAALPLAACTPDAPAQSPTPVPSPTFGCSTSTVNDPCTAEKAQKEKEQALAIASSTAAYKAFLKEWNWVGAAGGSATATPTMRMYASGPYLKAVTGFLADVKKAGVHYSSGSKISEFKYAAGERRSDSPAGELTFYFCQDGRQNKILDDAGKEVNSGALGAGRMYFREVDGHWKIWDTQDKEVAQCADGY